MKCAAGGENSSNNAHDPADYRKVGSRRRTWGLTRAPAGSGVETEFGVEHAVEIRRSRTRSRYPFRSRTSTCSSSHANEAREPFAYKDPAQLAHDTSGFQSENAPWSLFFQAQT